MVAAFDTVTPAEYPPPTGAPIYLTGVARADLAAYGRHTGRVGLLPTPASGTHRKIEDYPTWAADNGCFAEWTGGSWNRAAWLDWLADLADLNCCVGEDRQLVGSCLFATLPDVVCDWPATLARSMPWRDTVAEMGYPVALVLQNGATVESVPWAEIDAVFVGGDDAWKDGPAAAQLVAEAVERGKWAHVGRVNTWTRYAAAARAGADSVDGTGARFGREVVRRIERWTARTATAAHPHPDQLF